MATIDDRKCFLRGLKGAGMTPCIGIFTAHGGGYIIFGDGCTIVEDGVRIGIGTDYVTRWEEIRVVEIPQFVIRGLPPNDLDAIQQHFPDLPFIREIRNQSPQRQVVLSL